MISSKYLLRDIIVYQQQKVKPQVPIVRNYHDIQSAIVPIVLCPLESSKSFENWIHCL